MLSNSTDEPTASNSRGQAHPDAKGANEFDSVEDLVRIRAAGGDDHPLDVVFDDEGAQHVQLADHRRRLPGSPLIGGRSGTQPTSSALRSWLRSSFWRSRPGGRGVADTQAAIGRGRAPQRPLDRRTAKQHQREERQQQPEYLVLSEPAVDDCVLA
jgi:hypothetical protein